MIVVGGGPVGVELAAEIAAARPHLDITLVSRSKRLCSAMPPQVHERCEAWLECRGVRLVLGADVRELSESGCTLADGTQLDADVLYQCMGFRPATGALRTPTELDVLRQLKSARGTSFIASAVEAKSHSAPPPPCVTHTHTHVPVSGIWLFGVP